MVLSEDMFRPRSKHLQLSYKFQCTAIVRMPASSGEVVKFI